jgi:protein-S-isoprenylcysteine O-methyltransferase Ste14
MYGGLLVACVGYSIALLSWTALALTAVLAIVWHGKSRVEERWLTERYADYDDYRRSVRGRFLPYL